MHQDLESEISRAKQETRYEIELSLKEEKNAIISLQKQLKQQLELNSMDDDDKIKTLKSELQNANQTIVSLQNEIKNFEILKASKKISKVEPKIENESWKDKYHNMHNQLMTTLEREKELKCLLDEEHIKLKSAKREIDYLEKLLVTQNDDNTTKTQAISPPKKSNLALISDPPNTESSTPITIAPRSNQFEKVNVTKKSVSSALSQKYEQMELDLKKRLQIQAMLESDTRRLTYHTKEFFTNLNQQKNQTTQVMQILITLLCA